MRRQLNKVIVFALILVCFTGCNDNNLSSTTGSSSKSNTNINIDASKSSNTSSKKLKILVTNPLIKEVVTSIAGSNHTIDVLVNNENELVSYKPNVSGIVEANYDSVIYLGSGYEPFMKEILEKVDKNKTDVINLSRGIEIHRFKKDKLESEDYYFLTSSQNYQIALFSIKNVLEEIDRDRANDYENNFLNISKGIDKFRAEIKEFNNKNQNYKFVCENEHSTYIADEFGKDNLKIQDFKIQSAKNTNSQNSKSSNGAKEKLLFLYTSDSALKKYADDITKYKLKPIKIDLYDYNLNLVEIYTKNFQKIKDAVEN